MLRSVQTSRGCMKKVSTCKRGSTVSVFTLLQSPSVRVRQHVNPFTPTLQVGHFLANQPCGNTAETQQHFATLQKPVPPLDWSSIYADACRPLAIDIGCGECPLSLHLYCRLMNSVSTHSCSSPTDIGCGLHTAANLLTPQSAYT